MQESFKEGSVFSFVFSKEGGIELHFGEKVADFEIGCVKERGSKAHKGFILREDFLVNGIFCEGGFFAVIEAYHPVGIPSTTSFDPFSIKVVMARHGIDFVRIEGEL